MMGLALPVRSARRRLRCGCAAGALLGVATSLTLGVALPRPAAAQTSLAAGTVPVYLQRYATGNPFTIAAGTVIAPGRGAATAIYGDSGTSWKLTNSGTVRGGSVAAVQLQSPSTLTNAGTITSAVGDGGELAGGSTVANQAGADIRGYTAGIAIAGAGMVTNAGTIHAAAGAGVSLAGGGAVTNQAGGRITGYALGVSIAGAAGTLTNAGTIRSSAGSAVYLRAGSVGNATGAAIIGHATGVDAGYGAATVTNAGAITGTSRYGVLLNGGGLVTNQASGRITGGHTGIVLTYGGTAINAGTITGRGDDGIDIRAGGRVSNLAGGVITGAVAGVTALYPATVTNAGAITGGTVGVALGRGGTLTNAGTITGATASVSFAGAGTNLLTLQTGSVLNGAAIGSTAAGATNALVLQGSGTASNSFLNFNTLSVEASGAWTLAAAATIGTTAVSSGTLILAAPLTSSFAVGSGGTLQANSATLLAQGTISDNGALVFDQAASGTVTTGIAGSGSLVKQNAGTLTLSGANSFSGGVIVNDGTLVLGSATGFGSGSLTVNAGTADLSGFASTFTALAGSGGTVTLGSQSLTLNQSSDTSFAGTLSGNGSLVKAGAGTVVLNGSSSIASTLVAGGTLMVGDVAHPGASLAGSVMIDPGGTLAGHGTVIGAVTNGGAVSPGGSIGTLTITGNFVQSAGGILSIEVTPSASSQLAITGSASVAGTIIFAPDPGIYRKGTQYTFLTAAGGTSGGFSAVNTGGLAISVGDGPGGFGAAVTNSSFVGSTATANEQAIGNALAMAPDTGDANTVVLAVNAQAAGTPQNMLLDEAGGEAYADFKSVARSGIRDFLWRMSDRPAASGASDTVAAAAGAPIPSPSLASWGAAYGHLTSFGGDGNAHGYGGSLGGATAGLEHDFGGDVTAGLALDYGHSDFSLTGLGQSGGLDQTALGVYGERRWGRWFLDGSAALAYDHGDATRQIAFLGRTASGGFDGFAGGVAAKAGARIALTPLVSLEPSAALAWSHVDHAGFSESGANAADLALGGTSEDKGQAMLGARLVQRMPASTGVVTPELRLGWAHELNDPRTTIDESFAAIPGSGFTLTGAGTGRDLALVGVGLGYEATRRLALYVRYDGALGRHVADHAASAGITFSW